MGLCASEVINPEEVDLSHFQIMTTIGAGGFGKVRLAIDVKEQRINPNTYVAMKFLDVSYYYKPHRRDQLRREREALATIKSPFVVHLMHAFKSSDEIIFVMPFLQGGDFCVYLSRRSLTQQQVKFAAAECILGLEAIHRHKYVYRDLKPENILLDSNGHCVITDLGLVAKISEFDSKYNEPFSKRWDPPHHCRLRGVSGTPGYMAPEVFVKSYDQLADFFALGALIYSLFTNKVPFPNQSRKYFFKTAFVLPETVNRLSPTAKSFVKGLCAYYEKDRLGYKKFWDDVKAHPFFEAEKSFSWNRIEKRQSPSPFKITQDFNFDIRYNLEDTFALNYGVEADRMSREETKKIFDQLKGISYNNRPPFKLSDGTFYSVGNGVPPPPTTPHVLPKPPVNPTPQPDAKENKGLRRNKKITHMSKISVTHTPSKMSQRTLHSHMATGDSKRNSPAPSATMSPRTSQFHAKSRRAISNISHGSHPDNATQSFKDNGLLHSKRRINRHSQAKSDVSYKLAAPISNPAAPPVENPAATKEGATENSATSKPESR